MRPETLEYLKDIARAVGGTSFSICEPRDEEQMAREAEAFAAACVICASCQQAFDAVEVSATGPRCTECGALVCLWCGCTDERAAPADAVG